MLKLSLTVLSMLGVLSACSDTQSVTQANDEPQRNEQVENPQAPISLSSPGELAWVVNADAAKDVAQAIAKQDFRLLAVAGRGAMVPGVPLEQKDSLIAKCNVRYMQGTSDVLKDKQQREWQQRAIAYAKQYNALLLPFCQ
ncbi:hypothetical protein ACFOEE_00055 [Pseudoalteromonas fenneropenaei]|uniref:Lipoprotein n=1 Tax=Pseudoalteromonas fenneropenaei TaxID=1737459 RepID=A0ABV7CDV4_9GAMM